jgi:branched-chain amino acid transport system permease protein
MDNHANNGFQRLLDRACLTPLGFLGLMVLLVLPLVPPFNQDYLQRWMVVGLFMSAQAVAFDFTGGYINIVNFGYAAFVGLGAYTSAILSVKVGLSPWLGMFAGILPAALIGFLTGVLTLRLRGIYAAVMAWFIGLALMGLATKWVALTQGPLGFNCPTLLKTSSNLPYFYIIFGHLYCFKMGGSLPCGSGL